MCVRIALLSVMAVIVSVSVGVGQQAGAETADLTRESGSLDYEIDGVGELRSQLRTDRRFIYLANVPSDVNDHVADNRAELGVHVRQADATLRQHLKINGGFGLVIEHVTEGSAAEDCELRVHDVLYELDGQLLANLEQFQTLIDAHLPGDEVEIAFFRDGRETSLTAELGTKKTETVDLGSLEQYHKAILGNSNPHGKAFQLHDCASCHSSSVSMESEKTEFPSTRPSFQIPSIPNIKATDK